MPNKKSVLAGYVKSQIGEDLSAEVRELIDLSVRKQWSLQQFVTRLVNTRYFRQAFPGLVERNGTIANALTGEQGAGVSPQSIAGAIKNYRTALNQFGAISKQYGVQFDKRRLATALKADVSAQEFAQRLEVVDQVNANPALMDAYKKQLQLAGLKATDNSIYRAALGVGDRRFRDIYAASQLQAQGLADTRKDARGLARDVLPGGATTQSVDQIVNFARQNLASIGPELKAQGISAAQLVKILANPNAFPKEIEQLGTIAKQRQALFGRPVQGTYAQQGPGGGLSLYRREGEAAYG